MTKSDIEDSILSLLKEKSKDVPILDALKANRDGLKSLDDRLDGGEYANLIENNISEALVYALKNNLSLFEEYVKTFNENSEEIKNAFTDTINLIRDSKDSSDHYGYVTPYMFTFPLAVLGFDSKSTSTYLDVVNKLSPTKHRKEALWIGRTISKSDSAPERIYRINLSIESAFKFKDSLSRDFLINNAEEFAYSFKNTEEIIKNFEENHSQFDELISKISSHRIRFDVETNFKYFLEKNPSLVDSYITNINKLKNESNKDLCSELLKTADIKGKYSEFTELLDENHLDKIFKKFENDEDNREILKNNFVSLLPGLGEYAKPFLENIRSNFSKFKLIRIADNFAKKEDYLTDILYETDFEIDSNKKVDQLFKLVDLCSLTDDLDIELKDWKDINKTNIKQTNKYLTSRIEERFPNADIKEILELQPYLKYIKEDGDFSSFISAVINKEDPQGYEETLPNLDIPIKFEAKADPTELYNQLFDLATYYESITGNGFKGLKEDRDLDSYKQNARDMYDSLKDWKRKNADKIKENAKDIKEIEPNLERIVRVKETEIRDGVVSFDPYNFKDQLKALENVRSCLSPGGSNFNYTQHYFSNVPNIFFATFKTGEDNRNIVGRATIAVGYDVENRNQYVARVSGNNYSFVPLSTKELNRATKEYAELLGAEVKKTGEMNIPGIAEAYDDYLSSAEKENIVALTNTAVTTV